MIWGERITGRTESALRGAAPRARAFEILQIHPGSVAEAAGLRPGMLYLPRDRRGVPFAALKDREETGALSSRFVDEERRTVVHLRTMGFPFGVKLRRTLEGLCADIARGDESSDEIFERIHNGDDGDFARIVEALERPLRPSLASPLRLAQWLPGADRPIRRRWFVNQMAAGVFHALQGRPRLARDLMRPFEAEGVAVSLMTSLYAFGQSVLAELDGALPREVDGWLAQAAARNPKSRRIRARIVARGGAVRDDHGQKGPRPFPLNYCLLERDPLESVDPLRRPFAMLRETLAGLGTDQFLLVILLGPYRGNGYYVTLLDQFIQIHRLAGRHFPLIHVVTSHARGGRHFDEWLAGERRLRRRGLPFKVLHDPEDFVAAMLDITGSPTAAIVDRRGRIVHQGDLTDDEGYWAALATLPAPAGGAAPERRAAAEIGR